MDDNNKRLTDREKGLQREEYLTEYYRVLRSQQAEAARQDEEHLRNNPDELLKKIEGCKQTLKVNTWAIVGFVFAFLLFNSFGFSLLRDQGYKPEVMESNHAEFCYIPARKGVSFFTLEIPNHKFIRIYDGAPQFEFSSARNQVQLYPEGIQNPQGKNIYIDSIIARGGKLNSKWPTCVRLDGIQIKAIYLKRVFSGFDVQYLPLALWFNQDQLINNAHVYDYIADSDTSAFKFSLWFFSIVIIITALFRIPVYGKLRELKSFQSSVI